MRCITCEHEFYDVVKPNQNDAARHLRKKWNKRPIEAMLIKVLKEVAEYSDHFDDWDFPIGFHQKIVDTINKAEGKVTP